MGKESNEVLYKEAPPQGQNLIYVTQCFWQERLLFHLNLASNLKLQTYCGPTRFYTVG